MGLASFSVRVAPGGVEGMINDTELSDLDVTRVSVDYQKGQVPKVYVESSGDGLIQGEGIVQQSVQLEFNQSAAIRAWLDRIDPQAFEASALELLTIETMGSMTTGEAFLKVLKDRVNGQPNGT